MHRRNAVKEVVILDLEESYPFHYLFQLLLLWKLSDGLREIGISIPVACYKIADLRHNLERIKIVELAEKF